MKSKAFKGYCKQFPYLRNLVEWHSVEATRTMQPEDRTAFISVRPWETLDLDDTSHLWPSGHACYDMYGKVAYDIVWRVTNEHGYRYASASELRHTSSGSIKNIDELRSGDFRNVAEELQRINNLIRTGSRNNFWPSARIEAVVRIAWVGIHEYRSPLTIDVFLCPSLQY